jgi:hypothetical protein
MRLINAGVLYVADVRFSPDGRLLVVNTGADF